MSITPPDKLLKMIDLSQDLTYSQIARRVKMPRNRVYSILRSRGVRARLYNDACITSLVRVAAMIGIHRDSVGRYIRDKKLRAAITSRRTRGLGVRYDIDLSSVYDLARTGVALSWTANNATPKSLARIITETKAQYMSYTELVSACPLFFSPRMPWTNTKRPTPPHIKCGTDNLVYYEKRALYEILFTYYARYVPRHAIKADWLSAIVEAWHGTYITTADLKTLGVHGRIRTQIPHDRRGEYRRRDVVAMMRSIGRDDIARQVLGSEMTYHELMRPEDRV